MLARRRGQFDIAPNHLFQRAHGVNQLRDEYLFDFEVFFGIASCSGLQGEAVQAADAVGGAGNALKVLLQQAPRRALAASRSSADNK